MAKTAKTITNRKIKARQHAPHDPLGQTSGGHRPGPVESASRAFRERHEARNPTLEIESWPPSTYDRRDASSAGHHGGSGCPARTAYALACGTSSVKATMVG